MPGPGGEPTRLAQLQQALDPHGLRVRGAFAVTPADGIRAPAGAALAAAVVLVGNIGSSWWRPFDAAPEGHDGLPDPLDRWSRRIGDSIAVRFAAAALYPFGGPPHHPFQRWAARAEALHGSPLGLLIHPEHGLWHAYRFALALAEVPPDLQPLPAPRASPCDSCVAMPCLAACPVGAFSGAGYELRRCSSHLVAQPDSDCHARGCLARLACPIGARHAYQCEHARFHMRAFVRAHMASS